MSRTPLGAGDAIYCGSRDNGGEAAEGGADRLMVRAALRRGPAIDSARTSCRPPKGGLLSPRL